MGLQVGTNMRAHVHHEWASISLHYRTITTMDPHPRKKRRRHGKQHEIMRETDLVDAQEIVTVLQSSQRAISGFVYKDIAIPMHETNVPIPPAVMEQSPEPENTQEQCVPELTGEGEEGEEEEVRASKQRFKVCTNV